MGCVKSGLATIKHGLRRMRAGVQMETSTLSPQWSGRWRCSSCLLACCSLATSSPPWRGSWKCDFTASAFLCSPQAAPRPKLPKSRLLSP